MAPGGRSSTIDRRSGAPSGGLDYRGALEIRTGLWKLTSDFAALFDAEEPLRITRDAVVEFGETVAFPTLYPYLRQGISDLFNRLPVLGGALPLSRPGDLRLDREAMSEFFELRD
jgi:hypothetical protein